MIRKQKGEPDMESQASALRYYNYGSAAPALETFADAETKQMPTLVPKTPVKKEKAKRLEKIKAAADAKTAPGISVFAVLGTLIISVLMVFVVLAQINFNEAAGENVRLRVHISELTAKQRALELAFESVTDIKEVERFARDELGMSRPDTGQIVAISTTPRDTAVIIPVTEERGVRGFGVFLRSLTEYFK